MGAKILIVDDDPGIVVSLEYLMKKEGFDVAVAADGETALTAAADWKPDLILLDILLPGKSGYEVCQQLRTDPSQANLKIIMVTARSRDTDIAKGLALGADDYVVKPFSTRDLAAKVRALVAPAS